jgi:hypothetical protein
MFCIEDDNIETRSKNGIQWLSFTPDGKKLISYAGQTVSFWVKDNKQQDWAVPV